MLQCRPTDPDPDSDSDPVAYANAHTDAKSNPDDLSFTLAQPERHPGSE